MDDAELDQVSVMRTTDPGRARPSLTVRCTDRSDKPAWRNSSRRAAPAAARPAKNSRRRDSESSPLGPHREPGAGLADASDARAQTATRYRPSFPARAPSTSTTNLPRRPAADEARKAMLAQILHPDAADRLGRIRMVKEARAAEVEDRLLVLARAGRLREKVTEEQLKGLLSELAESRSREEERIVVSRRKGWGEGEDEDLLDL